MTTKALQAIEQLKADYHKRQNEKVDALTKKILDNTNEMRAGILKAIRENPKIAILEPFAKINQSASDDDGIIPMSVSVEVEIPEHAPIYILMHRDYQIAETPALWFLGGNTVPKVEFSVWHYEWRLHTDFHCNADLGEVLALAEERYVEYFHSQENEAVADNARAAQLSTRVPIPLTEAEEGMIKAMRAFWGEKTEE